MSSDPPDIPCDRRWSAAWNCLLNITTTLDSQGASLRYEMLRLIGNT